MIIPETADIKIVNDIIFHELCIGEIRDESRQRFQKIIDGLKEKVADSSLPILSQCWAHHKKKMLGNSKNFAFSSIFFLYCWNLSTSGFSDMQHNSVWSLYLHASSQRKQMQTKIPTILKREE